MSDLFGNHIVGFPTRRLIGLCNCARNLVTWFDLCIQNFEEVIHLNAYIYIV